jgi:hypothetical protein
MASTVNRKLTFYAWQDLDPNSPFDRVAAAEEIKKLEDTEEVIEEINESLVAVLVHDVGTDTTPTRFRLLPLRDYDNRPLRFRPGTNLSAIKIAASDYTSDVTHVTLWPDGYAAYDAHGFAPGPPRLAAYLNRKCDQAVDFVSLYDHDRIEYVKSLDGLTSVEFSITNSEKAQLAANSQKGVFAGLRSNRRGLVDSISFATKFSVGRAKGVVLDPEMQEDVFDLVEQADEYFDTLWITGIDPDTRKRVEVNVLQTRLHVPVSLPRAKGGGNRPAPKRCFAEIDKARKTLGETKLQQASRSRPKPPIN